MFGSSTRPTRLKKRSGTPVADPAARAVRPPARRSRRRGQSLVEFAVVFPVFMLVLSGVMDFGFLLYSRMTVINAVREGARVAIDAPVRSQIPSLARQRVTDAASGLNTSTLVIATVCVDKLAGGSCAWVNPPAAGAAEAGDSVRVTVTYPYRTFFPLLFGQSVDLTSTVQMVLE
jgi:Flp pilus assembly protein TadG